ncbi:hypothetical protein [Massilia sp. CF038]|uniref:hypothetical protein n=1 Tax=Massilia sp. CF038 TaxID=1881045 RepID=UPI000935142E|nr:hypothetical protein [Massilia sp. CF038]
MEDAPYAPPAASFEKPPAPPRLQDAFYVVSPLKLCIMFLVTAGYYTVYWNYKNWRCYKNHHPDGQEWPPARAIFQIFFLHDLLREANEYADAQGRPLNWKSDTDAGIMIALIVAWGVVDRLWSRDIAASYTAPLWAILGLVLLVYYCKVQGQINRACGDPHGAGNARLTAANYVWIVICMLLWLGFVASLVLPPAAT